MSNKYIRITLYALLVTILGFAFPSRAATQFDPSLKWMTIETPHFSIHYYPKIEQTAKRMVKIVEEVYNKLTPILKHTPDIKTEVVLTDFVDYANGFTTVVPYPYVQIIITDGNTNSRTVAYETWLKYVFLHEYAHVLHLDTVSRSGAFFKNVFGNVVFPNGIMPTYAIEGMATYFETRHGYGGGRGEDPRWEAMMRMEVLENNIKSIDQAAVNTVKWPDGNLRYLYGVMFLQFLADKYGEESLVRISQEYGDYFLSGSGLDLMFHNIYGRNYQELWNDWLDSLKKKFSKQKIELEKEGITKPQQLTNRGYQIFKPKWSPDSKDIFYSQNNEDEYPSIRRIDAQTLKDEKVLNGIVLDDSISLYNDKLYFSKSDIYKNFYFYKDIYSYDLKSQETKKITEGSRAGDPSISPDGKKIVYSKNNEGARTLWVFDLNTNKETLIGSNEKDVQYLSPVFSPDGKTIAVAKWTYGGNSDIYLINIETGKEEKLITNGLSGNPSFSPDGKYIIFDSDASGIVNLYACEIGSKKLYRITNVLGEALMPDVSPDGKKIAFINYSSLGYDLARIDYDPSKWIETKPKPVVKFAEKKTTEDLTGIITPNAKNIVPASFETFTHDYSPFPSILPKWWLPYSYGDENGSHTMVMTGGIDPLRQNIASLLFGFDWTAKRPTYSFIYENDQFLPLIVLSAFDTATPYSWDNNSRLYWERELGGGISFNFFNNRVFSEYDKMLFSIGYSANNLSNISSLEALTAKPSLGNLKGASVGWRYYSLKSYGYSIAPEDGVDTSFRAGFYSPDMGSDYAFNSYGASFSKYLGLGGHKVIAAKSSASYNQGRQLAQSGFTWNYLNLRGYPSNAFYGNKQIKGTLEFDFPISILESGWGHGFTFFDRLWGSLFFDAGGATFNKLDLLSFSKSYGMELNLSTINAYGNYPLTLILGYAEGIDAGGGQQIYISFGM